MGRHDLLTGSIAERNLQFRIIAGHTGGYNTEKRQIGGLKKDSWCDFKVNWPNSMLKGVVNG